MNHQGTLLLCSCQANRKAAKTYLIWSQTWWQLFQVCNCSCTKLPVNMFCMIYHFVIQYIHISFMYFMYQSVFYRDKPILSQQYLLLIFWVATAVPLLQAFGQNATKFKVSRSSGFVSRIALIFFFPFSLAFCDRFRSLCSFKLIFQLRLPSFRDSSVLLCSSVRCPCLERSLRATKSEFATWISACRCNLTGAFLASATTSNVFVLDAGSESSVTCRSFKSFILRCIEMRLFPLLVSRRR